MRRYPWKMVVVSICFATAGFAAFMQAEPVNANEDSIPKSTKELIEATKSGQLDRVDAAIKAGVSHNGPANQLTALHWAVAKRISDDVTVDPSPEIAKLLVEAGADVNATDYLGQTPLEWAVKHAPPETVQLLIKAGADVNAESRYGTILVAALRPDIAKLLIDAGADVNAGKISRPLANAARYGNIDLIQLLVQRGAKINERSDPPIHWAKKPEVAKILLEAGADVNIQNAKGETALHLAKNSWAPNADSVRVLIDAGGDVNAKNALGATPLQAAVQSARPSIAKLLIAAGASVDSVDNQGNTPLSKARAGLAWARGANQVEPAPYEDLVEILKGAGATNDGRTQLQHAVEANDLETVRSLIAAKVDVDETGPERITAMHIASEMGHAKILLALIEAGAKVDEANTLRMRPIHLAANAEVARLLIDKGANGSGVPPNPLTMAILNGRAGVVRELLKDAAKADSDGAADLLNWATFAGELQVIEVLFDMRGAKSLLRRTSTYSPLHVAASGSFGGMNCPTRVTQEKRIAIAKYLIEKGVDVNSGWGSGVDPRSGAAPMIGTTALMFAATKGDSAMVSFLLDQGADTSATSDGGKTALHNAAQRGHRDVAELLVDAKADVNALTWEGKTPFDLSRDNEMKSLLAAKGGKASSELPPNPID